MSVSARNGNNIGTIFSVLAAIFGGHQQPPLPLDEFITN
jgi:hypothetical protein